MLASSWRSWIGPLVTFAIGIVLLLIDRYLSTVPTPGALMFFPVLFAAYVGGVSPGLISTALSLAMAAILLSEPGQFLVLQPDNLKRLTVLSLLTPSTALVVGILQSRARQAWLRIAAASHKLESVRNALDRIDIVVMLLDQDLRVQFANRAVFVKGGMRERALGENPTAAELLHEFATSGTYPVPVDKIDQFVAKSINFVRSGDLTPIDLQLANGAIFRFKSVALPNGGWMLTYSDVTDLVRNAEQLEKLATTDGMTGLHNRRQFMKLAEAEWGRFQRHGHPLSLLMLDVDFFKSINDRFGHYVGDQVVAQIAALCREGRRVSDVVARIGGEEFALLLPETSIEAAYVVAGRLRRSVEVSPLLSNGNGLAVTVSIGVAEAAPGMSGIVDLMKDSDRALYEAKGAGRNRVILAEQVPIATMLDAEAPLQSA